MGVRHRADHVAGGSPRELRRKIAGKQRVDPPTWSVQRSASRGEYRTGLKAPPSFGDSSGGRPCHPFQLHHGETLEFDRLCTDYLADCPPPSDLRDLGARLETWLGKHPKYARGRRHRVALDMVRVEWAHLEASDGAELPKLSAADMMRVSGRSRLALQPHLHLLELSCPVDNILLAIRDRRRQPAELTSNAPSQRRNRGHKQKPVPLPAPEALHLAIHRYDDIVRFKRLEREAFLILRELRAGKRLSEALETVATTSVGRTLEQLTRWFSEWAALGWFCAPRQR